MNEISKTQNIRLIDVFILAPFMVYFAYRAKGISPLERNLMYGLGVATLIYNGRNYWLQRKLGLQSTNFLPRG